MLSNVLQMKQNCFSGFKIIFTTDASLSFPCERLTALDEHLNSVITNSSKSHNWEQVYNQRQQYLYQYYCKMVSRERAWGYTGWETTHNRSFCQLTSQKPSSLKSDLSQLHELLRSLNEKEIKEAKGQLWAMQHVKQPQKNQMNIKY